MNRIVGRRDKKRMAALQQMLGRAEPRVERSTASFEDALIETSKEIGFSSFERAELKRLYGRIMGDGGTR